MTEELSDPTALAVKVRRDARATSVAAAKRALPRSGTKRARVLYEIATAPAGCTDDEIITRTGFLHQSVGPRRLELEQGGWVEDSGERRKTRMGNPAIVWKLTPTAQARFDPALHR